MNDARLPRTGPVCRRMPTWLIAALLLPAVLLAGCTKPKPGAVSADPEKPPKLVKVGGKEVVAAQFESTRVTKAAIAALKKHGSLTTLSFYECQSFEPEALSNISTLPNVKSLEFIRSAIDDDDLLRLGAETHAAELSLAHTKVTSKGLASLRQWKHLTALKLKGGRPGHDDFAGLSGLTKLTKLELSGPGNEAGQLKVLKGLAALQSLSFGALELTDDQLAGLPSLPALRGLQFSAKQLTDTAVPHLLRFPELRRLDLSHSKISDEGLKKLTPLKRLEELVLDGCTGVTNDGMKSVAQLPSLMRISLTDSKVRGAGLLHLANAKNLKHVTLDIKQASAAQVKQLTAALPTCQVERIQVSP